MNRRNFVLGLGTAATLSGAASVTGASFANSVEASTTDFRVFVERSLTVNGNYYTDAQNEDFVSNDSNIDFGNVTQSDLNNNLPVAYADGSSDSGGDDLQVELAFDVDSPGETFEGVLEVENTGDTDETVGVTFEGGSGNGFAAPVTDGPISASNVAEAIQFIDGSDGSTRISPDPSTLGDDGTSTQSPENGLEVPSGNTVEIDIQLKDLSTVTGFEANVSQNASATGNAFDGAVDDVELIDAISVGTASGGSF
jgi:hypothetical protein